MAGWAARMLLPGSLVDDPPAYWSVLEYWHRELLAAIDAEGYRPDGPMQWQAEPLTHWITLDSGERLKIPGDWRDPETGEWIEWPDDGSAWILVRCRVTRK
jgi:hypothetical protein